MTPTTPQRL
ncbi:hypothetical protein YPPY63_1299, partial [Yersinia pestis PY-63]